LPDQTKGLYAGRPPPAILSLFDQPVLGGEMHTDETRTESTVVEATPQPAKQRKAKIAAAVVGLVLLAMGSGVGASLALGSAMGERGPTDAEKAAMSECPDGPPPGMGPS
jgi:hypothetical protein